MKHVYLKRQTIKIPEIDSLILIKSNYRPFRYYHFIIDTESVSKHPTLCSFSIFSLIFDFYNSCSFSLPSPVSSHFLPFCFSFNSISFSVSSFLLLSSLSSLLDRSLRPLSDHHFLVLGLLATTSTSASSSCGSFSYLYPGFFPKSGTVSSCVTIFWAQLEGEKLLQL